MLKFSDSYLLEHGNIQGKYMKKGKRKKEEREEN
jgi:hypothetical protein